MVCAVGTQTRAASPAGGLVVNIQILRFVAALAVVVAHALDRAGGMLPPGPANFGAIGVDIFFVISGYIITRSGFMRGSRSAAVFAWSRARRVVPLYWLMTLPWVAITLADGSFWIRRLLVTLTFWPALTNRTINPLLEVGWTLCFEMLFYTGAALVLLARDRRRAVLILGVLFVLCWGLRAMTGLGAFRFLGNPIILEFACGIAIARLQPRIAPRTGIAALVAGVAAMLASLWWGYGDISESHLTLDGTLALKRVAMWGLPSALVVAGAVAMAPWAKGRSARTLIAGGDASYALYLVHPLAILLLAFALAPLPAVAFVPAAILGALAAGLATHRWVERPLLRMLGARGELGAGQAPAR